VGYLFGDEGGGFDIVRQAIRAALRFEEGWGPATARTPLLEAAYAHDANDALHIFYTLAWPRPRGCAGCACRRRCLQGDAVARDILHTLQNSRRSVHPFAAACGSPVKRPHRVRRRSFSQPYVE
jgi:N-acetylglucosamine kinase-like BadF-type ATPase